MNYLIVSSYPPAKCGIGKYAQQMAEMLRASGNHVDILSINETDMGQYEKLSGDFNLLKIGKYIDGHDEVIIQYHDSFFYEPGNKIWSNIKTYLSFYYLFIRYHNKIKVIVHEIIYDKKGINHLLEYIKWKLCPRIEFHTQNEIDNFEKSYFKLSKGQYKLINHSHYFKKYTNLTKRECRRKLNIPEDKIIFLCIGFIQEHKRFDIIAKYFKELKNDKMKLYIVGSVRINEEYYLKYLRYLKDLVKDADNIILKDVFTNDEEFDEWINASDIIVLPYKQIWSSSVLARAKLYEKPVIARDVGGLSEQISDKDILFNTDEELRDIIHNFENEVLRKYGVMENA